MANTIKDSGGFKYVEMINGRFARKPLSGAFDGGAWTKIRVALRMDVTDTTGLVVGFNFFFGLCSGTATIPGDASAVNAIGAKNTDAFGTTYSGTAGAQQQYGELKTYKQVGAVLTAGTTFGNGLCAFNTTNNTNANGPSCGLFVTITKGAPNYSLDLFCVDPLFSAGMTSAQFATQSIALVPALAGHRNNSAKTIAFDEVAGTLDSAFVYWSPIPVLRILEWRVILLA